MTAGFVVEDSNFVESTRKTRGYRPRLQFCTARCYIVIVRRLSWRVLILLLFLTQRATPQSSVWIGVGYSAEAEGIRVTSLPYGSPAEKAGIRVGDLIVAVDERPAITDQQFRDVVSVHTAGD